VIFLREYSKNFVFSKKMSIIASIYLWLGKTIL